MALAQSVRATINTHRIQHMNDFLNVAIQAARKAQQIHLHYLNTGVDIKAKSGPADLVTQADGEAEVAVREMILQRYPNHAFVGEEGGSTGHSPYRWIVDPIDGTTNYAFGIPFYCVSIGLEVSGVLEVGVVLASATDELFTAVRGGGAFLNGQPIRVSSTTRIVDGLLDIGLPVRTPDTKVSLEAVHRSVQTSLPFRSFGSGALELAYVAAGRLTVFAQCGFQPWDMAAGALLVQEAGGKITDLSGQPFDLYGQWLLASNGPTHPELLGLFC